MRFVNLKDQIGYKNLLTSIIPFLFLMSVFFSQCSKDTTEPTQIVYPDSNLSFNQHIYPILSGNCATSGCHESINPAKGLDLETLTPSFISVNGPTVIPFNAVQSRLYRLILASDMGTPRMPLNRAPLPTSQVEAIKTWINEGAIINN
jgi:hypothetical protein